MSKPNDSPLLWRCALCGDPFPTAGPPLEAFWHRPQRTQRPCPCTTRKGPPPPPKPLGKFTAADVEALGAELAARNAVDLYEP